MAILLVLVLLALAPLTVSRATQKGVSSLTSLFMYGLSMFALPALYGPILAGWCNFVGVGSGCYGDGWTDLWIVLWTSAAALVVLMIVSAIAIFQYSDTDA